MGTQLRAVERGMQVISSYPEWKHTPIILGESDPEGCASLPGREKGYRNGPLYGASVAEATMRTYELARQYGVGVQGAVTWAFEFEDQPAFAGFRELATNGIDKPLLNVFRMLGMLGGGSKAGVSGAVWLKTESSGALPLEQVVANSVTGAPDINAVATRNGSEVDVLVWNYHDADLPAEPAHIDLDVDGLRGKSVTATEYRMDAGHSNAYRVWQQMGSPAQPNDEQMRQLEQAGRLEQSVPGHAIPILAGEVHIQLDLPRQGVALISVRGK